MEKVDKRLSYSSSNLLEGCEQRYVFYKVDQVKPDPDYDDNSEAFAIGKSFHHILEMSMHKKPEKIGSLLEECIQEHGLEESKAPLVHAMVLKYLRMHKTTNLEAVVCEYSIEDDIVIGFVDVVFKEPNGDWWISDLKTSARLSSTLISRLPQDRQLNLYSYFAPQIAAKFDLDIKKFKGCRYRLTTKSAARMRSTENYNDFVLRVADLVKTYDIIVPIEKMNPEAVYSEHVDRYMRTILLRDKKVDPKKNFAYCDSYFKPCPYWSKCHGNCFSDMSESLEVISL